MKKYALVFLSVFLFISAPFAAHANIVTATGRYLINAIKHVPGGAQVNATNTVTGAKHVIKHGVSSADLGKGIGAGIVGMAVGGGVGLAFQAITGLALDAVDWVLDPENNSVKYDETTTKIVNDVQLELTRLCKEDHARTGDGWGDGGIVGEMYHYDPNAYQCRTGDRIWRQTLGGGRGQDIEVTETIEKSIPIDTVAQKIIELADSGNAAAQKDVEDYVTNLATEGELDDELDNATDITKPDEPTKPEDPDKDCPIGTTKEGDVCVKPAPDNAPLFCNQSDFTRKVCDWIDWTQVKHDEPDAGKVDVIDKSKDLNIDKNRIDFSNQCPAPTPINTSVGGFPVSTELNYQPLCDFFTMLNPFVIGMGGISSALIIAGGARRG